MAKPKKKYDDLSKEEIRFIKKKLNVIKIQDIDTAILKQLKEALKQLKDTRQKGKIIFKLWDVVMCVVLASFAFFNTWEDIHIFVVDNYKWLKSFLQMTGGIPTEDSYERIMSLIDKNELNKILFDFFASIVNKLNPNIELLNFDEKRCEEIIAGNTQSSYYTENEKSHSSFIKYEYFQTSDINWYSKLSTWKKIHSFGLVRKSITKKVLVKNERKNAKKEKVEKLITTVENRYYISSKQVNIKEFSIATRGHWGVENKIHWHLDFIFCQDDNKTTNKKALLNLKIVHKFVLAILNRVKSRYQMSLKSVRKHLSNNFKEFLPEIFCYLMLN